MTPRLAKCLHPDRPAKGKSDLCSTCWRREHRAKLRLVDDTVRTIATTKAKLLTAAEAIDQAEQELLAAVPEAAAAIRRAIAVNPAMGPSGSTVSLKAAELLLTHLAIKPKGKRILEAPEKSAQIASSGPQVIIGLQLGPTGSVRPDITVNALPAAIETSDKA